MQEMNIFRVRKSQQTDATIIDNRGLYHSHRLRHRETDEYPQEKYFT